MRTAANAIEPAARPIGGRPFGALLDHHARPAPEARAGDGDQRSENRLPLDLDRPEVDDQRHAGDAEREAGDARVPSRSLSTGTAIIAAHSGTMPLMIAR